MAPPPTQPPTSTTATRVRGLLHPGVTARESPDGIVDTLPGPPPPAPGRAQAAWYTAPGSAAWQCIQPVLARLLVPGYRTVAAQLRLGPGLSAYELTSRARYDLTSRVSGVS